MGCGQSHIAVIYPRKGKGKASSNSGVGSDESDEEGGGTNQTENGGGGAGGIGSGGSMVGISNPIPTDDQDPNDPCSEDDEASRLRQMVHLSNSPLLAQAELSSSQSDFFKMLDDKINNGPDYDGSGEYELALDHAQLCRFLQEWQAAKTRAKCHAPAKLQRYQSLQNNGDPTGNSHSHQLHHQQSVGGTRQQQYHQQQQPPQHHHKMQNQTMVYQSMNSPMSAPAPPSAAPYNNYQPQFDHYQSYRQYQLHQQQQQQYHAAAQYHAAQYQVANSVVLYDKSRGGYYTELA